MLYHITTRPPGFSDLLTALILHTPLLLTLQEAISVAELSSTVVAAATKATTAAALSNSYLML